MFSFIVYSQKLTLHSPHPTKITNTTSHFFTNKIIKMLVIELPEAQLAPEVGSETTKRYLLSKQTTLMARALHIFHPEKCDQATCLGVIVAHNHRCKRPIERLKVSGVLIEMIDATEALSFSIENLRKLATEWGKELSCHNHKTQKGAQKAVLDGLMLYFKVAAQSKKISTPVIEKQTAFCGGNDKSGTADLEQLEQHLETTEDISQANVDNMTSVPVVEKQAACSGDKEKSGTADTEQPKEHLGMAENIPQAHVDKVSARIALLESKFDAFEVRLTEKHNAFFEMMRNDMRKEFNQQLRELEESFTKEDADLVECLTKRIRELEAQFELRLDAIMRGFADAVENCQARSQKREQFILSKCEEKKSNVQTQVNHVAKVLKVFYAED